jgi:hypothetical protein
MNNKTHLSIGLLATLIFSVIVLYFFYGNLFRSLNSICFANGGDGLQSVVNMNYHIRYDSSYLQCNSMNYPYGEHVFFTNNQPLISNTIKFISNNFTDISGYTLGILNFLMLFSLAITPLFLYLIFHELKVGMLLSIPASIAIAYLSPQIDRFGGHFNLSYVCAIPLMIYLLMRFFRKPNFILSILIFLTVFAGALTHFYLYGFFAILILFFYAGYAFKGEKVFSKPYLGLLHLLFQLVLPFLILQAFYLADHVTDRPGYPWGFLYYRAYLQSVFLPIGKPYGQFLHHFIKTNHIDWEGYAYVGLVVTIGSLIFLFKSIRKIFQKKYRHFPLISTNLQLNILFWASFAALLYSFGLPFILGPDFLVDLIGPIRQMRGIARFAWLFFFGMNIVVVYWLWIFLKEKNKKVIALIVITMALAILFYDAYLNVRGKGKWLENHFPELVDWHNQLPANQWINRINCKKFQAIIPLPYFHVGSENIWIDGNCDLVSKSFIAINNSGLPSMGVMLSRTSINQTVNNVALMLEPSYSSVKMSNFHSRKPFLLMAARCDKLKTHEIQLIEHSTWVDSSGTFDFYEAPFSIFRDIYDSLGLQVTHEFNTLPLFDHNGLKSTDSLNNFLYFTFDSLRYLKAYKEIDCYKGIAKIKNTIFSGNLPGADTSVFYIASFWLNNVRSDLYPRTRVTITETDIQGNIINSETFQAFQNFAMIDENQALVEWKFKLTNPSDIITITLQNKTLRRKPLEIDNLLIRPERTDVFKPSGNGIWKNNRKYIFSK